MGSASPIFKRDTREDANGAPERSEAPAELVGARVGNYRITEKLARGGMGEVYKAVHVGTGEVIACKRLGEHALEHDKAARHFLREVRAAMELRHPHIVRVMGLPIGRARRSC